MNRVRGLIKRIKGIISDKGGFTFTELLVATLIMALATAALTSAMMLAINHFYKETQRTEAQFLCATIAEFVEDELSFAKVSATPSDLKWSKGTHNMGSNVGFYVCNEAGNYVPITDSTIGEYGRIVITGDNYSGNYFKLANDGLYDVEKGHKYSLLAGMSMKWDATNKWYVVKIVVVDKDDKTLLSDDEFTVKPAVKAI